MEEIANSTFVRRHVVPGLLRKTCGMKLRIFKAKVLTLVSALPSFKLIVFTLVNIAKVSSWQTIS